jgi:hypothetical protein
LRLTVHNQIGRGRLDDALDAIGGRTDHKASVGLVDAPKPEDGGLVDHTDIYTVSPMMAGADGSVVLGTVGHVPLDRVLVKGIGLDLAAELGQATLVHCYIAC